MEEKLNKQKFIKRVIIGAWIALALCFVIKLFGGNYFNILCKNKNFISFCEYADNHKWATFVIYCIHCFVSLYFFALAIIQQYKFTKFQFIVVIITVIIGSIVKTWFAQFGIIYDLWQMIFMFVLFFKKKYKCYLRVIVGNILLIVFQLVSMFVKNLAIDIVTINGNLITFIYSIDITIMLILYYLYSNLSKLKKGD